MQMTKQSLLISKKCFSKVKKGLFRHMSIFFSVKPSLSPQATATRSNTSLLTAASLTARLSLSHGSPTVSGHIPAF